MIGIFVALLSGALMSIQGVFNTEVTRQSSVWVSASWVQFSALITCLVIWGIFDRKNLMLITRVSPAESSGSGAGDAQIYAVGRCDRRFYYLYSDSGNVGTGTGKGNDADRDCPADDLLAH